jgi:hypothetical protein
MKHVRGKALLATALVVWTHPLTGQETVIWGWRHTDHHLRQFAV